MGLSASMFSSSARIGPSVRISSSARKGRMGPRRYPPTRGGPAHGISFHDMTGQSSSNLQRMLSCGAARPAPTEGYGLHRTRKYSPYL